jgi:hypothetical protein
LTVSYSVSSQRDFNEAARDQVTETALHELGGGVAYGDGGAATACFWLELRRLVDAGASRVCEIGGGAKPAVPPWKVQKLGLEYVVLDDSPDELAEAPGGYRLLRADILDHSSVAEIVAAHGPFDLVVSRWTAEHIRDGQRCFTSTCSRC